MKQSELQRLLLLPPRRGHFPNPRPLVPSSATDQPELLPLPDSLAAVRPLQLEFLRPGDPHLWYQSQLRSLQQLNTC